VLRNAGNLIKFIKLMEEFYYMAIISISLTPELLEKLDTLMKERGYSSRSEVIRDAVREMLMEHELSALKAKSVIATITAIAEHEKQGAIERLIQLRHRYERIISADMHIHINGAYCLEVLVAKGDVNEVLDFIGRIRSIRGIKHVKYTIVSVA